MQTYDEVLEEISQARHEIQDSTGAFDIGDDAPEGLVVRLRNIEASIDRLANEAVEAVRLYQDDFGPNDVYFSVPATIRIHWSRDDKACLDASVHIDDFGWSPEYVEDDDGTTWRSDDNQCDRWRAFLSRELDNAPVSV